MAFEHLEKLLSDLHTTLNELEELQKLKQQALADSNLPEMERISEAEGQLVERLNQASEQRSQLLADEKSPSTSLREVIERLPEQRRKRMFEQLDGIRKHAQGIQQQTAANWLSTYRIHQHVVQMLEIITHANQAAVDDPRHAADHPGGAEGAGLMLDNTF